MPTLAQLVGTGTDPTLTQVTNSSPVVEPLDGPTTVDDVMDRFPEEVYQQGRDSHLYRLLSALGGDAGAGLIKAQTYAARLKFEAEFLNFSTLDDLYGTQFRFKRLKNETYPDYNPDTDALTPTQWDEIQLADQSYKQRIAEFFTATRYGNSPDGLKLAAQAGSGVECEIVENYKWIFDQFSDDPLGILFEGTTNSTSEFIVIPRFLNAGVVPDNLIPNGGFESDIYGYSEQVFNGAAGAISQSTSVAKFGAASLHQNVTNLGTGGDVGVGVYAGIGIDVVVGQPYTVSAYVLGPVGASCYWRRFDAAGEDPGGLTTTMDGKTFQRVTMTFTPVNPSVSFRIHTPALGDWYIDGVQLEPGTSATEYVDTNGAAVFGTNGYQQTYPTIFTPTTYPGTFNSTQRPSLGATPPSVSGAVSTTQTIAAMNPEVERNMLDIIDRLKPVGTIASINPQEIKYSAVAIQGDPHASSERVHVNRLVTGKTDVPWPALDPSQAYFIEAGIEHEAGSFYGSARELPSIFQTPENVHAYTEAALSDSTYGTNAFYDASSGVSAYDHYRSEYIGTFPPVMQAIYPFLANVQPDTQFEAGDAIAVVDTPLVLEGRAV